MDHSQLIQALTEHFLSGDRFSTIVEARRFAAPILGLEVKPGTAIARQLDEAIESSIVRVAKELIAQSTTTHETYGALVDLLDRQSQLTVRSGLLTNVIKKRKTAHVKHELS
ncbi:MAG: hypothetical protein F6K36_30095 [Symploca sp. SIO3C6]|nr:hypothetical protein [Symploca sp. SIO3C6]